MWFENKVEVSRCSLMDFELSSKRPGQRKFLCWTGWGIDCWYRSKTCKKKVSKKLIPWMLRLRIAMANNQSVRFNKGTQILEMKFACFGDGSDGVSKLSFRFFDFYCSMSEMNEWRLSWMKEYLQVSRKGNTEIFSSAFKGKGNMSPVRRLKIATLFL